MTVERLHDGSGKRRKKRLPKVSFDKKGTEEEGLFKVTYVYNDCWVIHRHANPPDSYYIYRMLTRCEIESVKIELDS